MKKAKFCILMILFSISTFSQSSFEIIVPRDGVEIAYQSLETNDNSYITYGWVSHEVVGEEKAIPCIYKYTNIGDTISYLFPKVDTSYSFNIGFQKENGNYLFIGSLFDINQTAYNYNIYLCELTSDFNLVWEKKYPIQEGYHIEIADYVIDNDKIILYSALAISPPYSMSYVHISKYNMEGDFLSSNFDLNYHIEIYDDLIKKPDGNGYYLIGDISLNGEPQGWLEIDEDLNFYPSGPILSDFWGSPITGKWLSSGNLLLGRTRHPTTPQEGQNLGMRLLDTDFNVLKDTVIFDTETQFIPVKQGMDFYDEEYVWTATFNYNLMNVGFDYIFQVYLFDSELNLKGMKTFGGDSQWWFEHLLATSDGGCIITGMEREPDGTSWSDLDMYILKLMPDDVLTSAEETPMDNDMDVAVYPNPVMDFLHLETALKAYSIDIFDNMGRMILHQEIRNSIHSQVNMQNLTNGFYFYTIKDNEHIIQSGKLLKK